MIELITNFVKDVWMANPFLLWGIGPSVTILLTYLTTVCILEWVIQQKWCEKYLLTYTKKDNRIKQLESIRNTKGMSFQDQLRSGLWQVAGPLNIVGCVFNGLVFPLVIPKHETILPTLNSFIFQMILLAIVADFGLYWGHRIQHDVEYLWKNFHSVHHQLHTPSPVSLYDIVIIA